MQIICLDQIGSTNTYIAQNHSNLPSETVIVTDNQTAGRGQRGNSWEAQPGKNLTFSILVRPNEFPAIRQFYISEATAVAIVDTLNDYLGINAKIKWPNDIYYNDLKLAGILIEHAIMGRDILHTIIGVGLNVNQTEFLSDAPNPVSIRQIIGHDSDRQQLLETICRRICHNISSLSDSDSMTRLHDHYMSLLWRNDGCMHLFRDVESGSTFNAKIDAIEPTGHLCLIEDNSCHSTRRYAFKEVEWIINHQ